MMTDVMMVTTRMPVAMGTLIQRLQRHLHKNQSRLRKQYDHDAYWVIRGNESARQIDLEQFARDEGVLAPFEEVIDSA